MPKQRGLLITDHAGYRYRPAQNVRVAMAEDMRIVVDFGQQRGGNAEQLEQLVVPFLLHDVVQQRAAGIGGIGRMDLAAGEAPKQE